MYNIIKNMSVSKFIFIPLNQPGRKYELFQNENENKGFNCQNFLTNEQINEINKFIIFIDQQRGPEIYWSKMMDYSLGSLSLKVQELNVYFKVDVNLERIALMSFLKIRGFLFKNAKMLQ
jgi:hypothetical protein